MDPFKKHFLGNRASIDVDEPDPLIWEQIQSRLSKPKASITILKITQWAAAACILVLAGIGGRHLMNNIDKNLPKQSIAKESSQPILPHTPSSVDAAAKHNEVVSKTTIVVKKTNQLKSKVSSNASAEQAVLKSIESTFIQVIHSQREQINTTPLYAESPEFFNSFTEQLKDIELDEKKVKRQITQQGLTDQFLNQLITIYQQKIMVLRQLQNQMQKLNNHYKQNRQPTDSNHIYFMTI